jgi:hypothetical protein
VGLLLVSGSVDVLVEEEEGNGVRNEENVPGVFSAGLTHQLTGVAEAVLSRAHRTIIDGPPSSILTSFPWSGTHVGPTAPVERGPSEGARSGSTGPT